MKTLLEYFIILFPLNYELVTDYVTIMIKKRNDNHAGDIPVRLAMCLLVGVLCHLFFDKAIVQGIIYSGAAFAAFDPLLNILSRKDWNHRGTNPTDLAWGTTSPWSEIFVRTAIIATGVFTYYIF